MQYLKNRNHLIALFCLSTACTAELDAPYDDTQSEEEAGTVVDPDHADPSMERADKSAASGPKSGLSEDTECLTVYAPPEEPSSTNKAAGQTRLVFLNRFGGTYTRGTNNASTNVSSIPSASSATLPAYEGTASDWQSLLSCVRSQYARFNVEITDVDPGAAQHIEAVVGGLPSALGLASNVGGISPFNCGVISRSIVYIFSRAYSSVRGECEAVAHEIGHSLGLEHEYLCQDPMTYLSGCGSKTFQDVPAQCGTSSAVSCQCGAATQNTVSKLLSNVGASLQAPTPPLVDAAPTVVLSSPVTGSVYARGALVSVRATASDDKALRDVQLTWTSAAGTSNYRLNALGGTSYGLDLRLSSSSLVGPRTLTLRATDDAGQSASSVPMTIQVR